MPYKATIRQSTKQGNLLPRSTFTSHNVSSKYLQHLSLTVHLLSFSGNLTITSIIHQRQPCFHNTTYTSLAHGMRRLERQVNLHLGYLHKLVTRWDSDFEDAMIRSCLLCSHISHLLCILAICHSLGSTLAMASIIGPTRCRLLLSKDN